MKNKKALAVSLLIPLLVGLLAAWLAPAAEAYTAFEKPALSPPPWVFPVVWTVLYVLMGVASYLVYQEKDCPHREKGLTAYAVQLVINFFWPLFFFRLGAYGLSFVWILLLFVAVFITWRYFSACSKAAGLLFIPYLLWVAFAAYLNYGVFRLN